MAAIVGVQHDVAVPGRVVVFARHALAGEVGCRGPDVAMVEHQDGKRTMPSGTFMTPEIVSPSPR